MRSVETVTNGKRQNRVAVMNDTSSIQASAVPPNRVLWWLVVGGNTALVTRVSDNSVRRWISTSLGVMPPPLLRRAPEEKSVAAAVRRFLSLLFAARPRQGEAGPGHQIAGKKKAARGL